MKKYNLIAEAIQYLALNREKQPTLSDLSAHIGLSEFHLQKIFTEWVGVSPKQFLQYLTKEYAKKKLKRESVLGAAFSTGLSSGSRLHDLMITWEGMTPGEYKNLGEGLKIEYGVCDSLFGKCFIAITQRGICNMHFFDSETEKVHLESDFHHEWKHAEIVNNQTAIKLLGEKIFNKAKFAKQPLKLLLKGTTFQLKVWEALLSIPEGELTTYQEIANSIHAPKAVRAAASAIAKNNIAYLIPCHRVIKQNGDFGQYRWNEYRKKALIAWEAGINDIDRT